MRVLGLLASKFFLIIISTQYLEAGFDQNKIRYMGPNDLIGVLLQKFPPNISDKRLDQKRLSKCTKIDRFNSIFLGINNPNLNRPSHKGPSLSFVDWYGSCLEELINTHFQHLMDDNGKMKDILDFFGDELAKKFEDKNYGSKLVPAKKRYDGLFKLQWEMVSERIKIGFVKKWVHHLIGPEPVIKDSGLVSDEGMLFKIILNSVNSPMQDRTIFEACKIIIFLICMRDEFLTY